MAGNVDHLGFALAVRTLGPPGDMVPRLREIVAEQDPNLPLYDLVPHDEALKQATWAFKLFGVQFTVFGGLALFLAAVGLYAVMSFSVSQRRREMGVRMALGAGRSSIIGLVLTKGARQLSVGMALGLIMGAAMSRPMRHVLYGVEAADPLVYVMIMVTLWAAGLLACVFPVRTAIRADPVESMRVG